MPNRHTRRAEAARATVTPHTEAPKSIITLTETQSGGFTIGLGLHGARMEELNPGTSHPVSIVDVIALAISHVVKSQPEDFKQAVALVNDTLQSLNAQIDAGADVDEAFDAASDQLDGAFDTVEA